MDPPPSIPRRPKTASYQSDILNRRHPLRPPTLPQASTLADRRLSSRVQAPAPASPEVISSLISSLSAISAPAEDFYDSLLPNASHRSAPASPSKSRNLRNEVISENPQPEVFFRINDAAIPPVVRTSKPPSGFSSLTAPKKSPTQPSFLFPTPGIHTPERIKSIGNISIEPKQKPSTTSLHSAASMKSKSIQSLGLKASKERLREIDKEYKRRMRAETPPKSPTFSLKKGKEKMTATSREKESGPDVPNRTVSMQLPPTIHSASPESTLLTGNGPTVPARDSSMRHSFGVTGKRKPKARRSSGSHLNEKDHQASAKGKESDDVENMPKQKCDLKGQRDLQGGTRMSTKGTSSATSQRRKKPAPLTSPLPESTNAKTRLSRPSSVSHASEKENRRPDDTPTTSKQRDPLARAVTEPLPIAHSTKRNELAPSIADSIDDAVEDYLQSPRLSQKVKEPHTGRVIAFSEVGDPNGAVVFVCVGMGTTRYLTAFYDELATSLKLRLITPDRPGIGESEAHADGTSPPLGWPGKHPSSNKKSN